MYPADLKYTKDHEWIRVRRRRARSASPTTPSSSSVTSCSSSCRRWAATVSQGEAFGTIESVKAVSELFAPVSGEVVERERGLKDSPERSTAIRTARGWSRSGWPIPARDRRRCSTARSTPIVVNRPAN